jgi:uridine kinase
VDFDLDVAIRTIVAGRAALDASRPLVVAIDGRSGTGKSTLARRLAEALPAAVIDGDDFFAGGVEVRADSAAERAAACIDWRRQRPALLALRAGQPASWRPFDWEAFDGRLAEKASTLDPAPIVLLEGVYSARPELADLVDLRILLELPESVRLARLSAREGVLGPWELQWHEAEEHYFGCVVPRTSFDLVLALGGA